jgi:NADP-dependent 3-hydroxy acid dehydrogenase YdfG
VIDYKSHAATELLIDGKVAVITGVSRGIGSAVAAYITGQVLYVDGGLLVAL